MKKYANILFDLDGTLTDPKIGITKSVAYALKSFGIEVKDLDSLCKFIGPPLKVSFRKYYGFSENDCIIRTLKQSRQILFHLSPHGFRINILCFGYKVHAG